MINFVRSFVAVVSTFLISGCLSEVGNEYQRSGSPSSYAPVEVPCDTVCYPGHSLSSLPVCDAAGWPEDHTLGCPSIKTKCYCIKNRQTIPGAL